MYVASSAPTGTITYQWLISFLETYPAAKCIIILSKSSSGYFSLLVHLLYLICVSDWAAYDARLILASSIVAQNYSTIVAVRKIATVSLACARGYVSPHPFHGRAVSNLTAPFGSWTFRSMMQENKPLPSIVLTITYWLLPPPSSSGYGAAIISWCSHVVGRCVANNNMTIVLIAFSSRALASYWKAAAHLHRNCAETCPTKCSCLATVMALGHFAVLFFSASGKYPSMLCRWPCLGHFVKRFHK